MIPNIDNERCICRKNKLLNIHEQCDHKKKDGEFCGKHAKSKEKLYANKPLPKEYSKFLTFSLYLEKGEKIFCKVSNLELINTLKLYKLNMPTKINKDTKEHMINDIKKHFDILKNYSSQEKLVKIKKIQSIVRNYIKNKELLLRGPGYLKRSQCNNQDDFLTFEPVINIPDKYFFSFKDEDDFIYGFDIRSFNKLIESKMSNPYNRKEIPQLAVKNMKKLIENPKYQLSEIKSVVSKEQKMNQRVLSVFQKIDQLDTYAGGTNINWFLNLSKNQLKLYYKVLEDIWNYRSELTSSRKNEIVPNKKMFPINVNSFYKLNEKSKLRKIVLQEMDKLVDSAEKREDKILGSYYVLIGLVEVSHEVATSLPWLVQV